MSISKKLLVGAVMVGAAGLLWYSCRNTAAAKDRATTKALEYVPADAELVFGFDIEAMRKNDIAWKMLAQRAEADPALRALARSCDYSLDDGIPRITIAVRDVERMHPTGVFVVQGRGVAKLVDCIDKDDHARRDGDTLFVGSRRHADAAMRLANKETLVGVFGRDVDKGTLDEVIARSGTSITSVASFDDLYREIDTTGTAWFLVKSSAFTHGLPIPNLPRAIGGSLDIGKNISGSLIVRFDSADDAAVVVGDAKRLASFLDETVTIDHDGADVRVHLTVSPETTRKMLRGLGTDW